MKTISISAALGLALLVGARQKEPRAWRPRAAPA